MWKLKKRKTENYIFKYAVRGTICVWSRNMIFGVSLGWCLKSRDHVMVPVLFTWKSSLIAHGNKHQTHTHTCTTHNYTYPKALFVLYSACYNILLFNWMRLISFSSTKLKIAIRTLTSPLFLPLFFLSSLLNFSLFYPPVSCFLFFLFYLFLIVFSDPRKVCLTLLILNKL